MVVTLQEVFEAFFGDLFKNAGLMEPDRRGLGSSTAAARRYSVATAGSELSSGHPVVIGMCADPEPEDAIFNLNSQRPVVKTNPHGPEGINLLEVQRRVVGVSL
jgi:hypothetical protein